MKLMRCALLTAVILTGFALPARAALDQAGAAKLKTLVESFVTEQKKLAEIDGKTRVELQGETTVEEAGEYYAVTLPYIKVIHPNGDQVDVGMVSINALPGDTAGQWKLRVAMPTPVIVSDKSGKELTRMTVGGQRAAGIWDESLRSFIKLDALYKDISFSGTDGSSLKVPETRIIYDFTRDAANKWSGPGTVTFKNIEAAPSTGGNLKIAEAKVDFSIDRYDSNAIRTYREKMAALSESMAKDAVGGKLSPAHTGAIASMMVDFFGAAGEGMKIRYSLNGLNIVKPASGANPAQTISIPSGFFGADLSGFSSGKVKLALQSGYNGLNVVPSTGTGLTPSEANIDITVENIPLRDVLNLTKNTIDASIAQPELSKAATALFVPKLYGLLSQSGAVLTVKDTHMGNADIDITMQGNARADISAVMGGTASSKIAIHGLDTLISRIEAQKAKPGSAANEIKLSQSLEKLRMFKNIARMENRPGAPAIHVVELELTPQGKTTINGEDLAAALAKAQKPAEKKPAAPKP